MTSSAAPPNAPTGLPVPRGVPDDAPAAHRARNWFRRGGPARSLAATRRQVPARWVPTVVRMRIRIDRRSSFMRGEARRQVEYLLGGTGCSPAHLDDVGERYLEHNAARAEMRWHADLLTHQDVEGLEHLRAAQASGRGVVLTFLHHGSYDGAFGSVVHAGAEPLHVLVASVLLDAAAEPFMTQHLALVATGGNTLVDAAGGSAQVRELLGGGHTVAMALDVVGRSEVTFCGRRRIGSSGAARIAYGAGVPVVAMTAVRGRDGRLGIALSAPFEPSEHADADALLATLLRHHETAVLAAPEAYHMPTTRWGDPA